MVRVTVNRDDPRLSQGISAAINAAGNSLNHTTVIPAILAHYRSKDWIVTTFIELAEELGLTYQQVLNAASTGLPTSQYGFPLNCNPLLQRTEDGANLYLMRESIFWDNAGVDTVYTCKVEPALFVDGLHVVTLLHESSLAFWEATRLEISPDKIEVVFEANLSYNSVWPEIKAIIEQLSPIHVPIEGSPGDYLLKEID